MGSLVGFSKTKTLVLLPLCQLELLAGVGGFLMPSWWSGGQSGEKSPSCPWVAGHVCPSCTCQGLLWRTPQKAGAGGGRCWARIHSSQAPRPQNAGCGARLSPAWG